MPVKLFPHLRLLNPSLPVARFSTMKPNPLVKQSRVIPIFSRIFPHKLKYQSLSMNLGFPTLRTQQQKHLSVRRFSTRSFRPRPSSNSEVRASKSLIDDEAELSDWVNELKSDSFRTRLYSDNDNDSGRGRSSDRRRGRDDERGGRDRDRDSASLVKRRRESDSDGSSVSNRPRARDSFESFSRNSRGKPRFGSEEGEGFMSPRRENGSRGGKNFSMENRRERGSESGSRWDRGSGGGGGGLKRENGSRGGKNFSMENRRERGSESGSRWDRGSGGGLKRENGSLGGKKFSMDNRRERGSELGSRLDRGSSVGGGGLKRENGSRGGKILSTERRRDRGSEMGSRLDRGSGGGGGGLKRGGKGLGTDLVMSSEEIDDDEGEEKLMDSFRDLISEEDSEEGDDDDDDGDDVFKNGSPLSHSANEDGRSISSRTSPEKSDSYLSETRFDQCSVSPLSLKGIKDAGYEKMTVVQEATLPVILKGKDVLAKAKTGTGKTVAFLLPSIEVVVKSAPVSLDQRRPPIIVLVICPTRELASQAAAEANTLLKYHPSVGVQIVIGGTRLPLEQKRIQANPCQILVATPGRLKDHIENTAGFATRLMGVKVLVLDEADHLLDMGFRKDIEKIIAAVPKQRQTLLFSATVPQEVRQICHIALKRDHEFINTVQEGTEETHAQVRQMHLVAPLDKHFSLLYVLLKEHIADDVDYKVLVFCTTAMVTRLVADLLGELNLNVREIHSRKPQSYRTRVSDEFRKSKGLILVTSDVSARGVDYPDVTLVIQVGLPSDREQYIHRLGRTGRKGKEGQGMLLLAPWEEFFLSTIKDLPTTKAPVPMVDPDTTKKVERALSNVEMKNKEAAYQAWLGYYNSNKNVGRDKYRLVELANEFSQSMGLDNPPAIPKLVLGKMGLRNVPGLRSK
uniref:ATP-dependent RNA helicase n=1 Tax=Davidia involucrata TaxID=16924 RepID=A0A5B7BIP0_DAVIN